MTPRRRHPRARVRTNRTPGAMNKTESSFAAVLEGKRRSGQIARYEFEPLQLILSHAPRISYTPDFLVVEADGTLTIYEIKAAWKDKKTGRYVAGWRDDARVKFKVAADRWPEFRFIAAAKLPQKAGGGWLYEEATKRCA